MENFYFYFPTTVYFGKGAISNLDTAINNIKKNANVLLVYGGGSIKRSGIYDEVKSSCERIGAKFFEFGGIEPNPRLSSVKKGIELCKENDIDIIIGAGGGSSIDASKAMAFTRFFEGDTWDGITCRQREITKVLPVIAIPTLAATGTETDGIAVITNEENNLKVGFGSDLVRPKAAIMDPTYEFTVNKYHTGAGSADIMSHLLENYFSGAKDAFLQKRYCEAVMKTVMKYAPIALEHPDDYAARSNLMWAASVAISGETIRGGIPCAWSCHPMEHIISGYYDITHGAGLAVLTPPWLRYITCEETVDDIAEFGINVFGIDEKLDKYEIAKIAADKLEEFFTSIGMPKTLRDAGVPTDEKLEEMANRVGTVKRSYRILTPEDILNIYKMCY